MGSTTADPFLNIINLSKVMNGLSRVKPPKVYADPDYLVDYKGCKVQYPFYLNLDQLDSFEPRDTDVCVAAFPKTGTTWMSAVVHMILHDGDPQSIQTGQPLKFKMPYIEMTIPYGDELSNEMKAIDFLEKQTDPREYVTHLNANATPKRIIDNAKVVYIYRNPKDTIVSMYHFMKASIWFGFHGTLEQVVDDVIRDHCTSGPFFEHIESFWRLRNQPNIFITSYEEMTREPKETIRKLAKFLEKDLSLEQLEQIFQHTDFIHMKKNPVTNFAELEALGLINARCSRFMRTGQVGNWKKHFTPEMNAKLDAWIAKSLADRPGLAGVEFQYELEQDYELD